MRPAEIILKITNTYKENLSKVKQDKMKEEDDANLTSHYIYKLESY